MRIAVIAGTRPEVIKLAPVYHEMKRRPECQPVFVSTGQHRQMLDTTAAAFGIKPDVDLNLMQARQSLAGLSVRVLDGVSRVLRDLRCDAVIVQGDTTTALFSSIASFYERIPVAHVEAGLRTYNLMAPWPEEMNRRLIAPITKWHFAPTTAARDNLLRENVSSDAIHVTGNTVIDALLWMRDRQETIEEEPLSRAVRCGVPAMFAQRYFGPERSRWILVTGHRRESFGDGFQALCDGLLDLVEADLEVGLIYPVHLNPQVREPVMRMLGRHPRIALIEPLGYADFVWLMSQAHFIITDSGGVQEEAPSLNKPVLVTRETTERPEAVMAGTSVLVGTRRDRLVAEALVLLRDSHAFAVRARCKNPYGDGRAAKRIVDCMVQDGIRPA